MYSHHFYSLLIHTTTVILMARDIDALVDTKFVMEFSTLLLGGGLDPHINLFLSESDVHKEKANLKKVYEKNLFSAVLDYGALKIE